MLLIGKLEHYPKSEERQKPFRIALEGKTLLLALSDKFDSLLAVFTHAHPLGFIISSPMASILS
jgi:hypothetical protein